MNDRAICALPVVSMSTLRKALGALLLAAVVSGPTDVLAADAGEQNAASTGPIRLAPAPLAPSQDPGQYQNQTPYQNQNQGQTPGSPSSLRGLSNEEANNLLMRQRQAQTTDLEFYHPGEFERFVSLIANTDMRRLGSELVTGDRSLLVEGPRQIPNDYLVGVGDEVQLTLWGSIDADLRLSVDRGGRIVIPRVGPVLVAGVRYGELNDVIRRRVEQVFRNFELSASLGRLRNIRVYVTGFTHRPGAYTVSSLATVVSGLMQAGGPSSAGSFRQIELRRGGKTLARFDLYDLLIRGDKSADLTLQAEDVIHIGAVGTQVAVLGSVNKPAIVEVKANETATDVLAMVGGFSAVADRSRIAIERLSDRNDRRIVELSLPAQGGLPLSNGDVLRVFSSVNTALPQYKQFKRVLIQGEVARPGEYILPPTSGLSDAITAAGGLTPNAYVFGAEFMRESVRIQQQENYERALRNLETEIARTMLAPKGLNATDATAQAARTANTDRLVDRLRAAKPTGRIVLQLNADARELPNLVVEDGDRLLVPAIPNTVGVFGSVFNGGSFLLQPASSLDDMLKLAGGPTSGADSGGIFVLRANGSVTSARQSGSGWFGSSASGLTRLAALPGDTIFVPEELNKTTLMQEVKDWTQILYQFGLGAAALKTLKE
jgi:protein involved in polysaccharide export with SLBB domain